ncbi:hypothetical protein AgCh_016492 [Apium graveolens]
MQTQGDVVKLLSLLLDGICYVYVDKSTNIEMAKQIVLDAKMDYPAACNVMETLIVHKDLMQRGAFNELITELQIKGATSGGQVYLWTSSY